QEMLSICTTPPPPPPPTTTTTTTKLYHHRPVPPAGFVFRPYQYPPLKVALYLLSPSIPGSQSKSHICPLLPSFPRHPTNTVPPSPPTSSLQQPPLSLQTSRTHPPPVSSHIPQHVPALPVLPNEKRTQEPRIRPSARISQCSKRVSHPSITITF
ncbi:hypothetical protein BO71DRAFT_408792, partial [Aspergillus ellipticus CBS 707.79]